MLWALEGGGENSSGISRFSQMGGGRTCSYVWGKKLLFGKSFAKNCMKMKEIGLGRASQAPP